MLRKRSDKIVRTNDGDNFKSARHIIHENNSVHCMLMHRIVHGCCATNIPSYVFHTFYLICPALSDEYFLRIGFHMTGHFFRFQGIPNIPSYVFHTSCLIYPALSDEYFLSIGLHMTCHFFRFQGIANIPSYFFHTFCLIYPALSDEYFFSIGFHITYYFI